MRAWWRASVSVAADAKQRKVTDDAEVGAMMPSAATMAWGGGGEPRRGAVLRVIFGWETSSSDGLYTVRSSSPLLSSSPTPATLIPPPFSSRRSPDGGGDPMKRDVKSFSSGLI